MTSHAAGLALLFQIVSFPSLGEVVGGPSLGWVFDERLKVFRSMVGPVGTASLSKAVELPLEVLWGAPSPRQDYLFVLSAPDGQAVVLNPTTGRWVARPVAGSLSRPDRVVLSPGGEAAVLYYRQGHKVQAVVGLPQAPRVSAEFDIGGIGEAAAELAVSDDGAALLVWAQEEDSGKLFLFRAGDAPRLLTAMGPQGAVSFLRRSRDAVLADRRRHELVLLRDVTGAAQRVVLAGEAEGISEPVAIGVSADNQWVVAANAGAATIAVADLKGYSLRLVACQCEPTSLHPMNRNFLFRLVGSSSDPVLLIDAGGPVPRVLVVAHPEYEIGEEARR